ncbi:helix-turn-helix domain-containing protein [Aliivibrio finisterrensis]|uniref:Helix-turn-helix transcriptional regulator n=1 Tax=Aliivibrio finisterrensis TaxID=511998 RepID=A0A6N6RW10_9GAMM|nr:helix-turn-helix transcriptional regulator [Aliivibrio finisterrensis]KAB2825895.1 helix-turn-helix transcriptional regulator [Aliivibrio finisterrensis]
MIKCHLSTLLGMKKLKVADVVRDTGVNRSTVNRLFHETNNRIDFDTLEKICTYLDCTVGDFLEVKHESNEE